MEDTLTQLNGESKNYKQRGIHAITYGLLPLFVGMVISRFVAMTPTAWRLLPIMVIVICMMFGVANIYNALDNRI